MENAKRTTVAVLFGGASDEYDVSLTSASAVLTALKETDFRVRAIGLTRRNEWLLYTGDVSLIKNGAWVHDTDHQTRVTLLGGASGGFCKKREDGTYAKMHIDVVFPVMHGQYGEDGRVQGALEVCGIPFVGCKTAASAICMDKAVTKALCAASGIPVARQVFLSRADLASATDACARVERELGFPCFVKPANSGSSVGASRADDILSLANALALAAKVDDKILVEEFIDAREVEVAVLEDGARLCVSHTGEIDPGAEFYDYDTKYKADTARYFMPARIPEETERAIRTYAEKIFRLLSCRHLSRVDFFVSKKDGRVVFNEINTLPGFTPISMYPKLMEKEGLPMPALVTHLVREALGE